MRVLKDLNFKKADCMTFKFHIMNLDLIINFQYMMILQINYKWIIYISPNENTGTIFDNKGHNKTVIDWKVNKGIFLVKMKLGTRMKETEKIIG